MYGKMAIAVTLRGRDPSLIDGGPDSPTKEISLFRSSVDIEDSCNDES